MGHKHVHSHPKWSGVTGGQMRLGPFWTLFWSRDGPFSGIRVGVSVLVVFVCTVPLCPRNLLYRDPLGGQ